MPIKIKRRLADKDSSGNTKLIDQDEIASFTEPVIILGDPGLGKSVLTAELGEQDGLQYIRAGTFVRSSDPAAVIGQGQRPIIDGLDEIASAVPGGPVESVLKQLSAIGSPAFVLSCREADWLGLPCTY